MTNKIQKKVTHYVRIDFNLSIYLKVLVIVYIIYIIDKDIRTNWKKILKFCFYPNRSTISFPNQEEVYFVLIRSNIVDHMVRVVVIIQPFYASAAQWALSKYRIILLYKTVGQPGFVSSDRSSYSDSVLLLVRRQLFQILSFYANIFSFSFWELNANW